MGKIKDKMIMDMRIRGFRENTIKNYVRGAQKLISFCNDKPPANITLSDINHFQHYLKGDCGYTWSTYNIHVCAVRFLFNVTLTKKYLIEYIPYHKRPKKLPIVLDKSEVRHIYKSTSELCHKALFLTLYSCGLRVSELVNLQIKNIDSKRMLIHIEDAKGGKDRYVLLSQKLLTLLREYYKSLKKPSSMYLFPGRITNKPVTTHSVQNNIRKIAKNAGVKKRVTPHTLRHSYATHMLESGVDVKKIQMIMGHGSLRTTAGYLHVVSDYLSLIKSPIDSMDI